MILEDVPVKTNITFEELLLQTIKAGTQNKTKRTRVASGAEVITSKDIFEKRKKIEDEKLKKILR